MIEGSLCLQGKYSVLIGTSGFSLSQNHIRLTCVVLDNLILDVITLTVDEVEDFISTGAWQSRLLRTRGIVLLERYSTKLANQGEIEISTCPTSLILIVLIEVHLLLVIQVELELVKGQTCPVVNHLVTISDTLVCLRPDGRTVVGRTPVTIVEVLHRIAIMAILRLIGSRGKHRTAEVTPIGINIRINGGHQSTYISE